MKFERGINGIVHRRCDSIFAAERNDVTGEPVELEFIAAFEIVQHRRFHAVGHLLRKLETVFGKISGEIDAAARADGSRFPRADARNMLRVSSSASTAPSGMRVMAVAPDRPTSITNFSQMSRCMVSRQRDVEAGGFRRA